MLCNVKRKRKWGFTSLCRQSSSLLIILFAVNICAAAIIKPYREFPLIIMGGHWSAVPKLDFSDLSRVCDTGFNHVFSYQTEAMLNTELTLTGAVKNAVEFASIVKKSCPRLGITMGIPRRWIYEGRLDLIEGYVTGLKTRGVPVDYWYSDEMIHQMTGEGLALQEAERRARSAIDTVTKVSKSPYIWAEPGNYDRRTSKILDLLVDLPAGIKSYDEYVISRTGRLSKSRESFNSIIATLKRLKSNGNIVFPVCEIGYLKKKNIAPLEEELAAISITLLMNGADGLVFWEERWTTPEILQSLKKIFPVIHYLHKIGIHNFIQTNDKYTLWEARNMDKIIRVVLNSTDADIDLNPMLQDGTIVLWPANEKPRKLKPMELLVYRSK